MSTATHIKVEMPVEDEDATYHDIIGGEDHRAAIVWWTASREGYVSVTAFGENTPGCQSWSPDRSELPEWIPTPPEWFYDALDDILSAKEEEG